MKKTSCFTLPSWRSRGLPQGALRHSRAAGAIALFLAFVWTGASSTAQAAQSDKIINEKATPTQASGEHWQDLSTAATATLTAKSASAGITAKTPASPGIKPRRFRATMLDRPA